MDWTSLIGPAVIAAAVSGAVSVMGTVIAARLNRRLQVDRNLFEKEQSHKKLAADLALQERRLQMDKEIADLKLRFDLAVKERDKRLAYYIETITLLPSIRRDLYSSEKLEAMLEKFRTLWLLAPENVVSVISDMHLAMRGKGDWQRWL